MADGNDILIDGIATSSDEGDATVISAGGADIVVVPLGDMILHADYARIGPDLRLTGPDGQVVVIKGFFAGSQPPALETAGGAQIPADLAAKLAGPDMLGKLAGGNGDDQILGGPGGDNLVGDPIGHVETAQGEVKVVRADGTTVVLQPGDPIFQGDTIVTGTGGAVGVLFVDKTTMGLGEDARMVIDELVFDPATKLGSQLFSLVQGTFVIASGEIGKLSPDSVEIRTPVATIGIRGTKFGVSVDSQSGETMVSIFEGAVEVRNSHGFAELRESCESVFVSSQYDPIGTIFAIDEVQKIHIFGKALRFAPHQPRLDIENLHPRD
ncbi:MAG: FecR domain-containing protein, partial [Alphaproteobacteria bacterium]